MTFKLLSVAENGGVSDTIAAELKTYYKGITTTTKVEISEKGRCTVNVSHGAYAPAFPKTGEVVIPEMTTKDIDSLIEFLHDAKKYMEEAKLFETLRGR